MELQNWLLLKKTFKRYKKKFSLSGERQKKEHEQTDARERERETERGLNVEFVSQFCKYGSF
jgi:ADP-ribose pyrophosphatase YjhB (NUDIX family)